MEMKEITEKEIVTKEVNVIKDKSKSNKPNKLVKRAFAYNTYPKHIVDLSIIIKNNSEIRRFTALGIINYLKQKEIIAKDDKCYINFKWNKFAINCNGLVKEYKYNETFFITAICAAFISFSNSAQLVINSFIENEHIDEEITNNDVNSIVNLINNSNEIVETNAD